MAPIPNVLGYVYDWLLTGKTSVGIKRSAELAVRYLHKHGMKISWKKRDRYRS